MARMYGTHVRDPVGSDAAALFPPFAPDFSAERRANRPLSRALNGAAGGLALGALCAIPEWLRARRALPPRSALRDVAETAALGAGSAFVECAVERFRGRADGVVAPVAGAVVPRVVAVAGSAVFAARRSGSPPRAAQLLRSLGASLAFPLANELLLRLPALLN